MNIDWISIVLDTPHADEAWETIFSELLSLARSSSSPVALHDHTIVPDRLLSEAAWELWEAYPLLAHRSSVALREWCRTASPVGRSVLLLDSLSLRELPLLLGAAEVRNIEVTQVKVTGSECPSTTDHFARALGIPSRSSLARDGKSGTFSLFKERYIRMWSLYHLKTVLCHL